MMQIFLWLASGKELKIQVLSINNRTVGNEQKGILRFRYSIGPFIQIWFLNEFFYFSSSFISSSAA
jgi:hypothetical protein